MAEEPPPQDIEAIVQKLEELNVHILNIHNNLSIVTTLAGTAIRMWFAVSSGKAPRDVLDNLDRRLASLAEQVERLSGEED